MNQPAEICDEHDLAIDEYGCWMCGHNGPLTDEAHLTFPRWASERPE